MSVGIEADEPVATAGVIEPAGLADDGRAGLVESAEHVVDRIDAVESEGEHVDPVVRCRSYTDDEGVDRLRQAEQDRPAPVLTDRLELPVVAQEGHLPLGVEGTQRDIRNLIDPLPSDRSPAGLVAHVAEQVAVHVRAAVGAR